MTDIESPTLDQRGDETHPAFGKVTVARVSSSEGQTLFDSEIQHRHFIEVTITPAVRKRQISRDFIHDVPKVLTQFRLSEAQWAQLVSSLNSSGTPVTLLRTESGPKPALPYEPRLAHTMDATKDAAHRMFAQAQEAMADYKAHKTAANLRALEMALANAEPNVTYAAKTLSEHAEDVVTKARADIEAAMDARAKQLGIDPAVETMPEIGS